MDNSNAGGATGVANAGNGTRKAAMSSLDLLRTLSSSLPALSSALTSSAPSLGAQAESAKLQASSVWQSAKPWGEFFDTKKMSLPETRNEFQDRISDNLLYFTNNYLICFTILCCGSILIHPLSLVCIVVLVGLYVYMFVQNPGVVKVGSLQLKSNGKLAVFAMVAFVVLYVTNAVGIIGSWALFGVIVSILHAACRKSVKEPDFESPVMPV